MSLDATASTVNINDPIPVQNPDLMEFAPIDIIGDGEGILEVDEDVAEDQDPLVEDILDLDEATTTTTEGSSMEKANRSKGNFCSTCDKSFTTKKILKRHSKIHSGEKSHPCPNQNCNMSFARKDHLMKHMVKHTKEKAFSCDSCNEKFKYKRSRDKHLKNKVCMM